MYLELDMKKSVALSLIYNVVGVVLARKNASAILAKSDVFNFGKADVVRLGGVMSDSDRSPTPPSVLPVVSVVVQAGQGPQPVVAEDEEKHIDFEEPLLEPLF